MSAVASTSAVTVSKTESASEQHDCGIGPNAIIQMARAITESQGSPTTKQIYADAKLLGYLTEVPDKLVDETEVMRFHQAARQVLGNPRYKENAKVAGRLTGDYLLANRIPAIVQRLLKILPNWLALRILNKAISKNAWTFVGSGSFSISYTASNLVLTIEDSPLARDLELPETACDFYAATFEHLYQQLINPDLTLREECCAASGAENCQFILQ